MVKNVIGRKLRRIRSFVRRNSRETDAQERARLAALPILGLQVDNGELNIDHAFGRQAPTFLEIGFGMGQSLLALATARPEFNLIGVETHQPGVGALFMGVAEQQLTNIRVYVADVVDVLHKCIPDASLDGVQIFFPDPWPKRRHHRRRLIQTAFIQLVTNKLKPEGTLHLATDWEDYAQHMLQVLTTEPRLVNIAGEGQFADRSPYRPVITKFEARAKREGRHVWELQYKRFSS